ncbi:MAG: isoprenylcysteine carboxylmethyltransferase family protein [Deltaproteobacteria bacterium]|nr:isoprenylcysteine carboxylmethyltransferase family protein [Deltaproteobacteria bacterium]
MDVDYFLRPSRWVFYAHTVFWAAFLVARMRALAGAGAAEQADQPRHRAEPVDAAHASLLVRAHVVTLVALYPLLWAACSVSRDAPTLLRGSLAVALIVGGGAVAAWALTVFRSYRLKATLEPGHELCQDGPFRYVRHPIYLAFGLLGAGTALWADTAALWGVAALLWLIADLRGRTEEKLLVETFGERYRSYLGSTSRLLPWVY